LKEYKPILCHVTVSTNIMSTPSSADKDKTLPQDAKLTLNEILRKISFRAEVFYRGQLCDTWALDTSGTGNVNFHIVCHGECWLHLPSEQTPTRLKNGDIVVFPHDSVHVIGSNPEKPTAFGIQQVSKQVNLDRLQPGTGLICGFLEIDHAVRRLLLGALPNYIVNV